MVGWTRVGREIRSLSSPCPSNAQCLSKGGPATRCVQSLSNSCQIPVQSTITWTDIGHITLCLSTSRLSEISIVNLGQSQDKLATWTMCRQGLDSLTYREAVPLKSWTNTGQILPPDKLWTKFLFPSIITSQLTAQKFNRRQSLDKC